MSSGRELNTNFDTVFALSTPVGGAIAVIRASGPAARAVLSSVFTGRIADHSLNYGRIVSGGSVLDESMAVFFPAPHSYTGEDMFELHLHGSYAVVNAVSALLLEKGLRPAEPGEFTKRAFLNGKMDLVQADAVMDLINAETQRSANAAMDQLRGGLSSRIGAIEQRLIDFGAELAAAMDYPEEMEDETLSAVPAALGPVVSELTELIENGRKNRILREGGKLVILGRPNAGKSSLMNALLKEDRAIVTEYACTTRDVLSEHLSLCGLPVRLVDTAGLREGADPVELIGIDRANREAETADCILLVLDGSRFAGEIEAEDEALIKKTSGMPAIYVINKYDLSPERAGSMASAVRGLVSGAEALTVSCKTGHGLVRLSETAAKLLGSAESEPLVTNARHIERLGFAAAELKLAMTVTETDLVSELVASALSALSEITGREYSEELLDLIFSRFCVGK